MRIYFLTQKDGFYIPKLLDKCIKNLDKNVEIVGASIIEGEISSSNFVTYLKFMGLIDFTKTGFAYAFYLFMAYLDKVMNFSKLYSVEAAFRKNKIKASYDGKINSEKFIKKIESLNVDLLVSVACPSIIGRKLRNLPKHKCINIHGGLLPKYRGKLPSFWVLANNEKVTGVTVHYVNAGIDDGKIIVQKEVPISESDTLHSLVLKSKVSFGAEALAEAINSILNGTVQPKENNKTKATYYSFPDADSVIRFRKLGRKFR